MTTRTVTWEPRMTSLGEAVVAIGVFDGVHLGHQALLRDTVADAESRGVASVAVTFDRDPDQIVSPQTAAPQLLTLADKVAFIGDIGVETVLVVPFTEQLAETSPEGFLDSVLLRAVRPVTVHVGADFRFGHMATGDIGTLQRSGLAHDFGVAPHSLVAVAGVPVTSTRVRTLVASGDVVGAAELLGRPTRVSGTVHLGRGEGTSLGFPTANVVPVAFAALPAEGVYAGRVVLPDGSEWASAISVGTPPMFPEARDYVEAHIIDFAGDLYDAPLTLEFFERLRGLESYASLDDLTAAIAHDVERSLAIAGFDEDGDSPSDAADEDESAEPTRGRSLLSALWPSFEETADENQGEMEDGMPVVNDPAALAAAELAAMDAPAPFEQEATGEWLPLLEDITIRVGPDASARAYQVTAPLEAAGIPYTWDPYPPADMMGAPYGGALPSVFGVRVPADRFGEASEAISESGSPYVSELLDEAAALQAAEASPREMAPPSEAAHADDWPILVADLPFDKQRLSALDAALFAAGIAAAWEPYRPDESPLLNLRLLSSNVFTVRVPAEELADARGVLGSFEASEHE